MAIPRNLANFAAGIDASNNIKAASGIFGTTPATTGVVRIPNDSPIYARNPGNDGDRHVIAFNSSGEVAIAGDGNNTVIGTSVGTVKTPTTISVGGATPAASGAGITFPADQTIIGASSDANTLDDYEEGTWTPNIGGTATYSYQNGYYRKIGSLVMITFIFQVNVIGTGSTQFISGLPFPVFNTSGSQGGGVSFATALALNFYSISTASAWGGSTQLGFALQQELDGGTTNGNAAVFQNSARIDANLTYIAA